MKSVFGAAGVEGLEKGASVSGLDIAVIGLTGSFGGAVARELARRGHRVRALVRSPERAMTATAGLPIHLVEGDVNSDALVPFLEGTDVLVHGFNVPYAQWARVVPGVSARVFDAAARLGLTVLFPGNVYGLGRAGMDPRPLPEDALRIATSKKGRLRNELEAMLAERVVGSAFAKTRGWPGLRAIVLRAGDYFGGADLAWFAHLVKGVLAGKALAWPSDLQLGHTWAYLPDLAVAAAQLLDRKDRLAAYEEFHFAGHHTTGHVMAQTIREALGKPDLVAKPMPWGLMQLARPFSSFVRELFDVRYVWTEAMPLEGGKLARVLGAEMVHTPLMVAVRQAIEELRPAPQAEPVPSPS